MKRECDICGDEFDEYWMRSYNTGRKTWWLCWECYQAAEREAAQSDMVRWKKLGKIAESKKRNK